MAKKQQKEPRPAYEVGRGKPPKHSQFKPGQSGNPGGRKKGSQNLKTIFRQVFESEIELTEGGEKRTVTYLEAAVRKLGRDALRGDRRDTEAFIAYAERYCEGNGDAAIETPEEDLAILARLHARASRQGGSRKWGNTSRKAGVDGGDALASVDPDGGGHV